MSSEWLKVMLDEVARKQAQAARDALELEQRRREELAGAVPVPPVADAQE